MTTGIAPKDPADPVAGPAHLPITKSQLTVRHNLLMCGAECFIAALAKVTTPAAFFCFKPPL